MHSHNADTASTIIYNVWNSFYGLCAHVYVKQACALWWVEYDFHLTVYSDFLQPSSLWFPPSCNGTIRAAYNHSIFVLKFWDWARFSCLQTTSDVPANLKAVGICDLSVGGNPGTCVQCKIVQGISDKNAVPLWVLIYATGFVLYSSYLLLVLHEYKVMQFFCSNCFAIWNPDILQLHEFQYNALLKVNDNIL